MKFETGSSAPAFRAFSGIAQIGRCLATVGCLLLVFCGVVGLKVNAEHRTGPGYLKEEFALQYRYARMIGEGGQVPRLDDKLQYPEGVRPHESLPLFMEHLTGWVFRFVREINASADFDEVIVWVKAVWSTMSVFACAALAHVVFRRKFPALVAALIFGLAPASAYRSFPSFAHEDFALPLLFGGFAGLVSCLRCERTLSRYLAAAAAAFFWLLATMTWHFAGFFLIAQSTVLLVLLVVSSASTIQCLKIAGGVIVAGLACGGTLSTHLRATQLIGSVPFWLFVSVFCLAMALDHWWGRKPQPKFASHRALPGLVVAMVFGACMLFVLSRDSESVYGHVWELLRTKLAHWNAKPEDPSLLSFDARVLWTGSFHGPGICQLVYRLSAPLLCSAIVLAGIRRLFSRAKEPGEKDVLVLLLLESLLFVMMAILVSRLAVFAVFYLSVLGSGLFARLTSRLEHWISAGVVAALSFILVCNYPAVTDFAWLRIPIATQPGTAAERFQPISQVDHSLFRWIELETPADAVFAGRFNVMPPVLAYADRAIVLHSKFEVPGIRSKVESHLRALFASEDELAAFCDRQGAGYYLYDPFTVFTTGSDSPRYLAGQLRVSKNSAAHMLHFSPSLLRRFELVYQNSLYRVFRRTDHPAPFDATKFSYQPLFDPARFDANETRAVFSDAAAESELVHLQKANEHLCRAIPLFSGGRWQQAFPVYQEALNIHPSLPYAHSHSARILLELGQPADALAHANRAVWVDPYEPEGWFHRGLIQWALQDFDAARESFGHCKRIDPKFPGLLQTTRN